MSPDLVYKGTINFIRVVDTLLRQEQISYVIHYLNMMVLTMATTLNFIKMKWGRLSDHIHYFICLRLFGGQFLLSTGKHLVFPREKVSVSICLHQV